MDEFKKYKDEILKKSGLSHSERDLFLSLVNSRIEYISKNEFKQLISIAEKISPDPNDIEYVALALKMKCNIWSNDKRLKEQDKVIVHNTSELMNQL